MIAQSMPTRWMKALRPNRSYLITVALVTAAYVASAKLGLRFAYDIKQVTPVWPPTGLALVVLFLLGRKYWWGIFFGALISNSLLREPLLVTMAVATSDTIEAVIAVTLMRKVLKAKKEFTQPKEALGFAGVAAFSSAVDAAIGPFVLVAGGVIGRDQYWQAAQLWWQADLMSYLWFTPLFLYYLGRRNFSVFRGRLMEAGLTLAATFGISILVFTSRQSGPMAFPYLLFPAAMWVAVRFRQVGVVTSTTLVALVAIWATVNGLGPFAAEDSLSAGLIAVQQYVCVLSATSLVLAMAIKERVAAEAALMSQTRELARLDGELKEANRRVTNILADILEGSRSGRRRNDSGSYQKNQL